MEIRDGHLHLLLLLWLLSPCTDISVGCSPPVTPPFPLQPVTPAPFSLSLLALPSQLPLLCSGLGQGFPLELPQLISAGHLHLFP